MAYFITKAEIKSAAFSRTINDDRIPDDLIEADGIKYLIPVLGEDFYDDVVSDPSATANAALKPYLVNYLAYFVKYDIMTDIFSEASDAGINMFTGSNKRNVSRAEFEALRQTTLDIAKIHGGRLLKFLEDNTDDYDLYFSSANAMNKVEIIGGIVFPKVKRTTIDNEEYI